MVYCWWLGIIINRIIRSYVICFDIKEITMEHHKNAERQEFVRILMSGNIDEKLYATYLYNQFQCYSVLEKYGLHNSLFRDTPSLLKS